MGLSSPNPAPPTRRLATIPIDDQPPRYHSHHRGLSSMWWCRTSNRSSPRDGILFPCSDQPPMTGSTSTKPDEVGSLWATGKGGFTRSLKVHEIVNSRFSASNLRLSPPRDERLL